MKHENTITKVTEDVLKLAKALELLGKILDIIVGAPPVLRVPAYAQLPAYPKRRLPPAPKRPKPVRSYRKTSPYWKKLLARKRKAAA